MRHLLDTRSLTRELGSRNVTANVVAPGFIETDMTAELPDKTKAEYQAAIPARRYGQADEVAAVTTPEDFVDLVARAIDRKTTGSTPEDA